MTDANYGAAADKAAAAFPVKSLALDQIFAAAANSVLGLQIGPSVKLLSFSSAIIKS